MVDPGREIRTGAEEGTARETDGTEAGTGVDLAGEDHLQAGASKMATIKRQHTFAKAFIM